MKEIQIKTTVLYQYTSRKAKIKNIGYTKCWQRCRTMEALYTFGDNLKCFKHFGKQLCIFPKKLKMQQPHDPSSNYLLKRKKSTWPHKDLQKMLTVVLFVIEKH